MTAELATDTLRQARTLSSGKLIEKQPTRMLRVLPSTDC